VKGRRGYTIVELLIVVCILGILATIVMPQVQGSRARARAASVLGAMRAVRIAATIYYDSAGAWPPSAGLGNVPRGLAGYLPSTVDFSGDGYQLRWQVTTVRAGGTRTTVANLQARTSDRLLCPPIGILLGGPSPTLTVACGAGSGRVTETIER
jgi:prepilin-type N-terminal cleavage/methylation domain-containing protein